MRALIVIFFAFVGGWGCRSSALKMEDFVGRWNGIGTMGPTSSSEPLFVLVLNSDKTCQLSSLAGELTGRWELRPSAIDLVGLAFGDGGPQGRTTSLEFRGREELVWTMDLSKGDYQVVFRRAESPTP